MKIIRLELEGSCILEPQYFEDDRGYFVESYSKRTLEENGIYINFIQDNQKYSIYHKKLLPNYVLLQTEFLYSLPNYQKKCTLLDALCQGIESYWSLSSTEESRKLAELGIRKIWNNKEAFLDNNDNALKEVLLGANFCGRAIQITKTTAPHAMSYKLTSLFSIPHGHAVALCLPNVWELMFNNLSDDIRIDENIHLKKSCDDLIRFFNLNSPNEAIGEFRVLLSQWDITSPRPPTETELRLLCESVDELRLSNHPIKLTQNEIKVIYENIWKY